MSSSMSSSNPHGEESLGGNIFIPQIDINLNFIVSLKNSLTTPPGSEGEVIRSRTLSNGQFLEMNYNNPIIHLKEFNSFYEKENFEIEAFEVIDPNKNGNEELLPLSIDTKSSNIINNILIDSGDGDGTSATRDGDFEITEEDSIGRNHLEYFFSLVVDDEIATETLCKVVDSLEINSQFLDEELICPDQRTDRFNIYNTRVNPDDLEDCD